jgi:hypothetical protein
MRRWLLLILGAVCVLPLAAVDPAMALLLLDVEFLVALGSGGVILLRGDARVAWHRFLDTPTVLIFRAGVRLTRESPASLLHT